jgi:hypothetical protein
MPHPITQGEKDNKDLGAPAASFARFLKTASLASLVNEHSALNRRLNLSGAELWGEQYAEDQERLAAIWRAIGSRFPAYIAGQKRLAAERAEHERQVRSDKRGGTPTTVAITCRPVSPLPCATSPGPSALSFSVSSNPNDPP